MYWDILDKERTKILPKFEVFKKDFYLAGGTALALQIGHRDSVDFDFFSQKALSDTDAPRIWTENFSDNAVMKTQDEKNTLSLLINNSIKVSFFSYEYELVEPKVTGDYFNLASIEDIGCMKFSAIVSRSMLKDYVDLYWILKRISLPEMLSYSEKKLKDLDINLILKSLVFFDDLESDPIVFKNGMDVSLETIKGFLKKEVQSLKI